MSDASRSECRVAQEVLAMYLPGTSLKDARFKGGFSWIFDMPSGIRSGPLAKRNLPSGCTWDLVRLAFVGDVDRSEFHAIVQNLLDVYALAACSGTTPPMRIVDAVYEHHLGFIITVMQEIKHVVPFRKWFKTLGNDVERVLVMLLQLGAGLERAGVLHTDVSHRNVLLSNPPGGGQPRFWFIDVDDSCVPTNKYRKMFCLQKQTFQDGYQHPKAESENTRFFRHEHNAKNKAMLFALTALAAYCAKQSTTLSSAGAVRAMEAKLDEDFVDDVVRLRFDTVQEALSHVTPTRKRRRRCSSNKTNRRGSSSSGGGGPKKKRRATTS